MNDGATPHGVAPSSRSARVRRSTSRRKTLWVVVLLLLGLLLVRGAVAETFTVPSSSMTPTLRPGDRIVAWKPGSQQVRRGDVVVFNATEAFALGTSPTGIAGRLRQAEHALGIRVGEIDYVKRVAAIGGDTVVIGADGTLRVNGSAVREPYLDGRTAPVGQPLRVQVPAGAVFVLGDNRANSQDSRAHLGSPGGGMVPVGDIIGQVTLRYWPSDSWGTLSG